MTRHTNSLVFNTTAAKYSTLATEVDIARRFGFEGLETTAKKVLDYLDAGFSDGDLQDLLKGLQVFGIGTVLDIERHGDDLHSMMREAGEIFEIAARCGSKGVQVITGPLNYQAVEHYQANGNTSQYIGVLGLPEEEKLEITARNLASLADEARNYGIIVYLEALAWSPLNTLEHQVELLRRANRPNLKMVVDYWHCYTSGNTAEDVSRLDKELIYGVHVCDALPFQGGVPNEVVLRNVPMGKGVLDLRQWTDAVKSTGYDDWWSAETFCKREYQTNPYEIAPNFKYLLDDLVQPS